MDTTKIIKGVVNSGRYTVTAPIIKEDYGLYLQIEGVELPSTYEVDFSNDEHHGTSVTMIGNADGVKIPRQFIDTGKDVFAFLYWVGEDYGKTVYKFRIPNKVRPDRTDETPTPEEQSTIDQAISALNSAVAQTAQDVIDADASAQSASQSAENAHDSAVDAQNYAESAQTRANNASASASQASASATASAQSASDAETARQATTSLVAEAQGYANASEQSATASANSAEQAESAKGVAQSYAQDAQTSATYASLSESTASNKASEASGYASTASQKATESAQSATNAQTYATQAEQAKTASQTAQGKAEDAQTAAETAQGKAEDAQEAAESAAASVSASAAQIATNTADIADLQTDVAQNEADILKAFPTDSASGAIASFPDGADDIPLKSLIVNIDPVQDTSSGDPSPENICPISGWTGCEVNATGKNLLTYVPNKLYAPLSVTLNKSRATLVKKGITYSMSFDMQNATTWRIGAVLFDIEGNRYFVDYENSLGRVNPILAPNLSGQYYVWDGNYTTKSIVLTPIDDFYVMFFFLLGDTTESTVMVNPMLEVGSTATAYKPYVGQNITIDLGQTVYGAKLYPLEGKAVVDRAIFRYEEFAGNISSDVASEHGYIRFVCVLDKKQGVTNVLSNLFPTHNTVIPQRPDFEAISGILSGIGLYLSINASRLSGDLSTSGGRAAAIRNWSRENGLEICYELAEPIEIQLTPNQVNSLLGVNNIFADTGDIEVIYRADTKLYINRLTEPDADMIADSNIVSGQYFMVGNNLYKATANIANGGQITVGTNCTRVSLAQALNEINA